MMLKALNKCFRARYKIFLFKSYFKIKPRTAIGRIWIGFTKKYCEDIRVSFQLWRVTHQSEDLRRFQHKKHAKIMIFLNTWNKSVKDTLKKGFLAFLKDSKPLKIRLIRGIINS